MEKKYKDRTRITLRIEKDVYEYLKAEKKKVEGGEKFVSMNQIINNKLREVSQ